MFGIPITKTELIHQEINRLCRDDSRFIAAEERYEGAMNLAKLASDEMDMIRDEMERGLAEDTEFMESIKHAPELRPYHG